MHHYACPHYYKFFIIIIIYIHVHIQMYMYCFSACNSARVPVLLYSFMHNDALCVTIQCSSQYVYLRGLVGLLVIVSPSSAQTIPSHHALNCDTSLLGIPLPVPDGNQSLISEGLTQPTFQPPRKYLTVHGHNFAVVG